MRAIEARYEDGLLKPEALSPSSQETSGADRGPSS